MNQDKKMMQIVGAVSRTAEDETKTFWSRIGVEFQNEDGSWNLRFDYLPARMADTTIQLREFDAKESGNGKEPEHDRPREAAAPRGRAAAR